MRAIACESLGEPPSAVPRSLQSKPAFFKNSSILDLDWNISLARMAWIRLDWRMKLCYGHICGKTELGWTGKLMEDGARVKWRLDRVRLGMGCRLLPI